MSVIYDYFAAESDERAASVLGLAGGPAGSAPEAEPGLLAAVRAGEMTAYQEMRTPRVRWSEHGFQVLGGKGIDPGVELATLEELLTGVSWENVMDGPRSGARIAAVGDYEPWVASVTDELQQALAHREADDFEQVAAAWVQTEEFQFDAGDAAPLARFLRELAGLARDALNRGDRLYCWICL